MFAGSIEDGIGNGACGSDSSSFSSRPPCNIWAWNQFKLCFWKLVKSQDWIIEPVHACYFFSVKVNLLMQRPAESLYEPAFDLIHKAIWIEDQTAIESHKNIGNADVA